MLINCQINVIFLNSYNLELKVEDNTLLITIPAFGPLFRISFEVKVLSFVNPYPFGVANYLTFTATGNDCCDIGDRIPAFFTNIGGFFQLATQINVNGNFTKMSPQLDENVWYNLEVEQLIENHQV